MINRILMEMYDDYSENNNIDKLIDFTGKTFPSNGTDNLFIGCVLILFSLAGCYKPRYFCSRENLLAVVLLSKEKIGNSNLLAFYVDRVNNVDGKRINKYLREIIYADNLDNYADLIIDYLEGFKFDLISELKNHRGIDKYIKYMDEKI